MNNLLVTTEWLAQHLNDEQMRIVDIRGRVLPASEPPPHYFSHHEDYLESHIPNAVFVDWTSDIVEPDSPSYDVANPERYTALMSKLGIANDTTVVVYDDANGMFAARFWWTLTYYGHDGVFVLDGGWQKWLKGDYPTTLDIPEITSSNFLPKINSSLIATRVQIEESSPQLLDVRSPSEFAGETSRAQRKGHIPNAVNISRKSLVTTEGILKSSEELQELFSEQGITSDSSDVIVYCNSGVSASYGLLALRAAGIGNSRIYDGSWKEWGNDPNTAIE